MPSFKEQGFSRVSGLNFNSWARCCRFRNIDVMRFRHQSLGSYTPTTRSSNATGFDCQWKAFPVSSCLQSGPIRSDYPSVLTQLSLICRQKSSLVKIEQSHRHSEQTCVDTHLLEGEGISFDVLKREKKDAIERDCFIDTTIHLRTQTPLCT